MRITFISAIANCNQNWVSISLGRWTLVYGNLGATHRVQTGRLVYNSIPNFLNLNRKASSG